MGIFYIPNNQAHHHATGYFHRAEPNHMRGVPLTKSDDFHRHLSGIIDLSYSHNLPFSHRILFPNYTLEEFIYLIGVTTQQESLWGIIIIMISKCSSFMGSWTRNTSTNIGPLGRPELGGEQTFSWSDVAAPGRGGWVPRGGPRCTGCMDNRCTLLSVTCRSTSSPHN